MANSIRGKNKAYRALLLALGGIASCARAPEKTATPPLLAQPTYIGSAACRACHELQSELWSGSDHALAMQAADSNTVLGNFNNVIFEKDGVSTKFFRRDNTYFVHTDGPDGQLQEYRIAYTFGVHPLQQYLIAFPGGRYQALNIVWDTRPAANGGQRWFHLYPLERIDYRDILHWTGPLQNWNYMCADCHSTDLRKNFAPAGNRFASTWAEMNVACEACHGPGSAHVAWATQGPATGDQLARTRGLVVQLKDTTDLWQLQPGQTTARRVRPLASRAELETCGRCHARRSQVAEAYVPGQPLAQNYRLALLDNLLYYADGQTRDEVYEYGSFLQSKMYHEGVTCSDCHDPHSARLSRSGNAVCTACHLLEHYDNPQHHFHAANTEAAQCVSCHMVKRYYMVVDGRRDHSFRVPRPDLSAKLGTPNACTGCHPDRSAAWAAAAAAKWYGPNRKSGWHYAEAIAAGRNGLAGGESQLVRAATDATVPAIARATALELLYPYLSENSLRAVEQGVRAPDPLQRRAAVATLAAVEPQRRLALGWPLLQDSIRTVRLEAVTTLAGIPSDYFSPQQRAAFELAVAEYRQVQTYNADRAEAYLNLGALEAQLGHLAEAEKDYRQAIQMQASFVPAYINLADLYRTSGREDLVEQTLQAALKIDAQNGDAYFALGLSYVRQKRLREALQLLEKAKTLQPASAHYAYVYAVALHDAGELIPALEVLQSAQRRHPDDREILIALVEYQKQAGDRKAAAIWARRLVEISPGDVTALNLLESLETSP